LKITPQATQNSNDIETESLPSTKPENSHYNDKVQREKANSGMVNTLQRRQDSNPGRGDDARK
jgi:hypothetical protein